MNSKACCNIQKVLLLKAVPKLGPGSKHKNEARNSRDTQDLYEECRQLRNWSWGDSFRELGLGLLERWEKDERISHWLWLDGFCCFLLQKETNRWDATGTMQWAIVIITGSMLFAWPVFTEQIDQAFDCEDFLSATAGRPTIWALIIKNTLLIGRHTLNTCLPVMDKRTLAVLVNKVGETFCLKNTF